MYSKTPEILSFPSKINREVLSQSQLDQLKAGAGTTGLAVALTAVSAVLRPYANGDQMGIAVTASVPTLVIGGLGRILA